MHRNTDRKQLAAQGPSVQEVPGLVDSHGRLHQSLRVSVTDRCNIRCFYCMPADDVVFLPKSRILSYEQIHRVVAILADAGIRNLRLTGGEPLVRQDLPRLIRMLASVPGIEDIALTTNGMLLAEHAAALRAAGLQRVNISLDTLREATFQKISRRQGLHRVLGGIEAALATGFDEVRLNALAIRGMIEDEVIALVEFASARQITMRFIEYMPLDADHGWRAEQVLSGDELLERLEQRFGPSQALQPPSAAQPARDYRFAGGQRVGLIRPVTAPFCGACDRLRLTADGSLRNCLFSAEEWSLRGHLQAGDDDAKILASIRQCVAAKRPGHLIEQPGFQPPERAMYQIGG